MATESPLPPRILDAAEEVLRRHGAEKTNVVDVARVLGMSHANIYRHFTSKKALLDAVAARWLHRVNAPLKIIAADTSQPAVKRLVGWFDALRLAKRRKILDDPELFQVYQNVTESAHEVVAAHIDDLLAQLRCIVSDGVTAGDFAESLDAAAAARAILMATVLFHHPAMVVQRPAPTEEDARAVIGLVVAGLRAGTIT